MPFKKTVVKTQEASLGNNNQMSIDSAISAVLSQLDSILKIRGFAAVKLDNLEVNENDKMFIKSSTSILHGTNNFVTRLPKETNPQDFWYIVLD